MGVARLLLYIGTIQSYRRRLNKYPTVNKFTHSWVVGDASSVLLLMLRSFQYQ